jgi:replication factor C subunit 3/5
MTELLCDLYQPKLWSDFSNNQQLIEKLQGLATLTSAQALPHLIIQGPAGCGKKSIAMTFLAQMFGPQVYQRKKHLYDENLEIIQSTHHYQFNPTVHGIHDRATIQIFLKQIVRFRPINHRFHLILLEDADKLTHEAQQSLRRTLEKYISAFRCIFISQNLGCLIPAIQSRCLILRMSAPLASDMALKLNMVNLSPVSRDLVLRHHNRSWTKMWNDAEIVCQMELLQIKVVKYTEISWIYGKIQDIVRTLYQSADFKFIDEVRQCIYGLLIHGYEAEDILLHLFQALIKVLPNEPKIQKKLIMAATECQDTLAKGSKQIFHLECFLMQVLLIIKEFLIKPKN